MANNFGPNIHFGLLKYNNTTGHKKMSIENWHNKNSLYILCRSSIVASDGPQD